MIERLVCHTCGFVTGLPPAVCPLCGDTMEATNEAPKPDLSAALPPTDLWAVGPDVKPLSSRHAA